MRGWRNVAGISLLGIPGALLFGNLNIGTNGPELVFLSVGQGDSVLIKSDGITALVDAGPKTDWFDAGERLVSPKLRQRGVVVIDVVFLTHPDSDHIGGLPAVARRFKIGMVAMPSHFRGSKELLDVLESAGIDNSRRRWLKDGSTVEFGASHITLRFTKLSDDDNSGSLLMKLTCAGGSTAVLTGDAGEEQELAMLGRDDWRAQVLKAGHHGSGTSTSESWLRAVRPQFVVISCGRDNQFGHPAEAVLERSRQAGAAIFRTDMLGDIEFVATSAGFKPVSRR